MNAALVSYDYLPGLHSCTIKTKTIKITKAPSVVRTAEVGSRDEHARLIGAHLKSIRVDKEGEEEEKNKMLLHRNPVYQVHLRGHFKAWRGWGILEAGLKTTTNNSLFLFG